MGVTTSDVQGVPTVGVATSAGQAEGADGVTGRHKPFENISSARHDVWYVSVESVCVTVDMSIKGFCALYVELPLSVPAVMARDSDCDRESVVVKELLILNCKFDWSDAGTLEEVKTSSELEKVLESAMSVLCEKGLGLVNEKWSSVVIKSEK